MASMMTLSTGTICSFLHLGQVCITFHGPVLSDHLDKKQVHRRSGSMSSSTSRATAATAKVAGSTKPRQKNLGRLMSIETIYKQHEGQEESNTHQ